jgi:hypothetical protein
MDAAKYDITHISSKLYIRLYLRIIIVQANRPGVYTKVEPYLSWITDTIASNTYLYNGYRNPDPINVTDTDSTFVVSGLVVADSQLTCYVSGLINITIANYTATVKLSGASVQDPLCLNAATVTTQSTSAAFFHATGLRNGCEYQCSVAATEPSGVVHVTSIVKSLVVNKPCPPPSNVVLTNDGVHFFLSWALYSEVGCPQPVGCVNIYSARILSYIFGITYYTHNNTLDMW